MSFSSRTTAATEGIQDNIMTSGIESTFMEWRDRDSGGTRTDNVVMNDGTDDFSSGDDIDFSLTSIFSFQFLTHQQKI